MQAAITGGDNRTISLADDYIYVARPTAEIDYPTGYTGSDYLG